MLSKGGFLLCNIHYQKQADWWPLTFESIFSVTCMQTGTHLHSFKISQKSNPQEIRWVKSHPLQCILVRWLVSAMHNVCFPKWNGQQLICAAARQCPHRPTSLSTCHMHYSQRQYSSCQSDKAPTYSNSEEAKPMALSLEEWGRLYSDTGKEGGRIVWGRGRAKERVAFRLGVGSDGEAAMHTEMRLWKEVWWHFH